MLVVTDDHVLLNLIVRIRSASHEYFKEGKDIREGCPFMSIQGMTEQDRTLTEEGDLFQG